VKNEEQKRRDIFTVHMANAQEADPNEWPWVVFLNFGPKPKLNAYSSHCMGFLISPEYIATASHCLYWKDAGVFTKHVPQNVFAWLGAHDRRTWIRGYDLHVKQVNISEVIVHPEYVLPSEVAGTNKAQWNNDYGLLRVSEPITMNDYIRPVCVPQTAHEMALFKEGDESTPVGMVAGWGYTTVSSAIAYVLREANMPSVTNEDCKSDIAELSRRQGFTLSPNAQITENMFCAGFKNGRSAATCQGDSGSAYVVNDSNNKYYAFGIVSFAAGTCGLESYTSFAKMTPAASAWYSNKAGL